MRCSGAARASSSAWQMPPRLVASSQPPPPLPQHNRCAQSTPRGGKHRGQLAQRTPPLRSAPSLPAPPSRPRQFPGAAAARGIQSAPPGASCAGAGARSPPAHRPPGVCPPPCSPPTLAPPPSRKPLETSPPMWALVATAAAGLNAGHGLASLMDHNVMMDVGTDHYSAGGCAGGGAGGRRRLCAGEGQRTCWSVFSALTAVWAVFGGSDRRRPRSRRRRSAPALPEGRA